MAERPTTGRGFDGVPGLIRKPIEPAPPTLAQQIWPNLPTDAKPVPDAKEQR